MKLDGEKIAKIIAMTSSDEEIEKMAGIKDEKEIEKIAEEKFKNMPIEQALEVVTPVIKVSSLKEALGCL